MLLVRRITIAFQTDTFDIWSKLDKKKVVHAKNIQEFKDSDIEMDRTNIALFLFTMQNQTSYRLNI